MLCFIDFSGMMDVLSPIRLVITVRRFCDDLVRISSDISPSGFQNQRAQTFDAA